MNKLKLMTYVEDVMKEYDIPDTLKNKKRIRAMFEKRLKKEGLWDSAELVKSSNRRSHAKVFVIEELERIKLELHDYLKANNAGAIVKNVLEKDLERKQTAVKLEMAKLRGEQPGNLSIEWINKPLPAHQDPRWEISDKMRLDIMIEALFYAQFEDIDTKQWYEDRKLVGQYYAGNYIAQAKGRPIREKNSSERAASERLNNRVQSYCRRK